MRGEGKSKNSPIPPLKLKTQTEWGVRKKDLGGVGEEVNICMVEKSSRGKLGSARCKKSSRLGLKKCWRSQTIR